MKARSKVTEADIGSYARHSASCFEDSCRYEASFGTSGKFIPRCADYGSDLKSCFVIIPLTEPFNCVYSEIKQIVESRGMSCLRSDETFGQGILMSTIVGAIRRATIVIADISLHNPNVFYEVGVAYTLGKKTILLWAIGGDKIPFDLCHWQYIQYENTLSGGPDLRRKLGAAVDHMMKNITS